MEKRMCACLLFLVAMCLGMATSLPWIFLMHRTDALSSPSGVSHSFEDSPCGDWSPYKHDKCIKLVVRAGLQTKEDGETICKKFAEEFHTEEIPKLVTIKTQEKQNFVQELLFENLGTIDNVWLGAELGRNDKFRWNDGTDLLFTYLVEDNTTDSKRQCLQMESGEGVYEVGKWVRANCKKKNAVVCERSQPWSVVALQNIILNVKLEVGRNKKESEQKLNDAKHEYEQRLNDIKKESEQKLKDSEQKCNDTIKNSVSRLLNDSKSEYEQKLKAAKTEYEQKVNAVEKYSELKFNETIKKCEKILTDAKTQAEQKLNDMNQNFNDANLKISSLQQNPVPVGFIYVQLPGQNSPTDLWPNLSWEDVGYHYAGLFFRVEGGSAAPFGKLQEDNTRRLSQVDNNYSNGSTNFGPISSDGSWSKYVWTGGIVGKGMGVKFRLTTGEVRPQNKAVKLWQRIKS